MDVIKKSISGLLVFGALAISGNCFAQKKPVTSGNHGVQFYFDKPITLDSLTKYVHNRSRIRFSFNSSKVKGDKMIYLKKGAYSIDQLLQEIRKNTTLYYSMYNGYVIFQDNPPKQKIKPTAIVKKNRVKPSVQHVQVRKRVAGSNKKDLQVTPEKRIGDKPITNAPQEKTNKLPDQPKPVSPTQVAVIASGVHADTPLTNSNQPVKSSNLIRDSVSPATATGKMGEPNNRLQNKRDISRGGKTTGKWNLQYGLQWNVNLPLYGSKNYFTGANNRSQPYNLLIPGIWLSNRFNDKHEMLLVIKPTAWYFLNNKEFSHAIGYNGAMPGDTLMVRKSYRLLKTNDIYAGLQYNYHINENWLVGGGIGYHRSGRALILQQTRKITNGMYLPDSLYTASTDTASRYLANGLLTGKLEIAYHFGAVDIGVSMLMPITNPFTKHSSNQSRPLNGQIFLRWRINRTEKG